jgi:ribonuclease VapC
LREKLKLYKQRSLSGLVVYESVLALQRLSGSSHEAMMELVKGFQHSYAFIREPVAIDWRVVDLAINAFQTYGKGRSKAKLNLGDCFSYACAKSIKAKLLFKGNDFSQTDIEIA